MRTDWEVVPLYSTSSVFACRITVSTPTNRQCSTSLINCRVRQTVECNRIYPDIKLLALYTLEFAPPIARKVPMPTHADSIHIFCTQFPEVDIQLTVYLSGDFCPQICLLCMQESPFCSEISNILSTQVGISECEDGYRKGEGAAKGH